MIHVKIAVEATFNNLLKGPGQEYVSNFWAFFTENGDLLHQEKDLSCEKKCQVKVAVADMMHDG